MRIDCTLGVTTLTLFLALISLGFLTPTPAFASELSPIPIVYNASTSESIVLAYAVRYGIDGREFLATAKCESGLNANALNPKDPNGGSKGVFQFQPQTFAKYSQKAGLFKADVWNPFDNIETAAYLFSIGGQHNWSCWKSQFGDRSG